jgi:hypothetical protein
MQALAIHLELEWVAIFLLCGLEMLNGSTFPQILLKSPLQKVCDERSTRFLDTMAETVF